MLQKRPFQYQFGQHDRVCAPGKILILLVIKYVFIFNILCSLIITVVSGNVDFIALYRTVVVFSKINTALANGY